jgi:NTP pyrophosphatase (non-canonical NTP hydrolase)
VQKHNFDRIVEVIDTLTGPGGCPWDKEQTPQSMCDYLVEECFELVEAVRQNDPAEIAEELGDVLFLLLFIGRYMDREIPDFLQSALAGNVAKMIRRHPHVYGEKAADVAEVVVNWEKIKKQEKVEKDKDPGVFASLPASLPPLLRAYRINSKPPGPVSPGPRTRTRKPSWPRNGGSCRPPCPATTPRPGRRSSAITSFRWWSMAGAAASRPIRPCPWPTPSSSAASRPWKSWQPSAVWSWTG